MIIRGDSMNGPYVVFDDNSTYAADGYIAFISDKAQEILEDTVDFKHIEYELGGELGVERRYGFRICWQHMIRFTERIFCQRGVA